MVPPRFPPELWNVFETVRAGVMRTTNSIEGWHSGFQKKVATHHPNIWKFMDFLRKDESNNSGLITQLLAGHSRIKHPIKRKYVTNLRRIKEMVRTYETYKNNQIRTYLRGLAHRIKVNPHEIVEDEDDLR